MRSSSRSMMDANISSLMDGQARESFLSFELAETDLSTRRKASNEASPDCFSIMSNAVCC